MSGKFKVIDRDPTYLLPPSLQDWLPEKHLARFVVDIVEQLDLSQLKKHYGGGGKQPYQPALLLALLFYGYAAGVFSRRKLEQATYDSVAFCYITGDTHPDHDTITNFRKLFLPELENLFVQLLVIANLMGLFKLGHVSPVGTKIKANASKHKAISWGHANKLEAQLQCEVPELLKRAEQADAEDEPGIDIPAEIGRRGDRLAALEEAKAEIECRVQARLEAEQAEYKEKQDKSGKKACGRAPKPPESGSRDKDQVNFTDEESRIMPSSEGFVQAYNVQSVVDIEPHLIVENHVTQQSNDKQEIELALKRLREQEDNLGKVDDLLADAGYFSEANVKRCEAEELTPYISDNREHHNLPWDERFKSPSPCPEDADAVTTMKYLLRTPEDIALYAKCKSTVETVFGIIKEVLGFCRFHLRGFESVQGEWNLVCMAWNIKRMYALAN